MRRIVTMLVVLTMTGSMTARVGAQESVEPNCSDLVPTIVGTRGNDRIHGTPGPDVITGGWGHDAIWGHGGDDVICGGVQDDYLNGGDGDDNVFGFKGEDTLVGGLGDDYIKDVDFATVFGNEGHDLITARYWVNAVPGAGDDVIHNDRLGTIDFAYATAGVTVDVEEGTAAGEGSDTFTGITYVFGSSHDDTIRGTPSLDRLYGRAGNDAIFGEGLSDLLDGGTGNDHLDGGAEGGNGDLDVLSVGTSPVGADISLIRGTSTGPGDDSILEFEWVAGSIYDDVIEGDDGDNGLAGSDGIDRVSGLGGDDTIVSSESGDAGAGMDECISSPSVENCETHETRGRDWVAAEVVSPRPLETISAESFDGVAAQVVPGRGPAVRRIVVTLSQSSDQGCRWWNEHLDRFVWRACARPQWNDVVDPDETLAPGNYRAWAMAVLVDGTWTDEDVVSFTLE